MTQTLNSSKVKKGKEKKNKTLQNTLEERHAHIKTHAQNALLLRKEGDDDDEGRV